MKRGVPLGENNEIGAWPAPLRSGGTRAGRRPETDEQTFL
jgi:hypothetical protein